MTPWGKAYDSKMREHLQLLLWWRQTPLRDLQAALGNVHHSQVERRLEGKPLIRAWELAALLRVVGVDQLEFYAGILGGLHAEVYLAHIAQENTRQKDYAGSDLIAKGPSRVYTAEELRDVADGLQDLRVVDPEAARGQALDVVRAAHHYGIDPGVESLFKANLALGAVYRARGGYGTAATFLLKALDLAGTDARMRSRLLHSIINFASDMGDFEVGLQAADAAIAGFERLKDQLGRGRVLVSKGSLLGRYGQQSEAIELLEASLPLVSKGRWYDRFYPLHGLCLSYIVLNDLSEALKYADQIAVAVRGETLSSKQIMEVRWLRGEILLRMGSTTGIQELRAVLETSSKQNDSKLKLALISLRLAAVYYDYAQTEELRKLASSLAPLLGSVASDNKLLRGALTEFNSLMLRGDLSRELLDRTYRTVLEASRDVPTAAHLALNRSS